MTSTERKRAWRLAHPERSRESERVRAMARRNGYWREPTLGAMPRPCVSHDSYYRYEWSTKRTLQRINWPRLGAGSTTMSREERAAAYKTYFDDRVRALGLDPELARVDPIAAVLA